MHKINYYSSSISFPLFLFFFIIHICFAGEEKSTIAIRFDGFNSILFNQEYPYLSSSLFSLINGNPIDSFPFNYLTAFQVISQDEIGKSNLGSEDSLFQVQISAIAGSETGEGMLNRFKNSSLENRDHLSSLAAACSFPHTPLNIYFAYRYVDIYSDRFDSLWQKYDTTGHSLEHTEEGLGYELIGGYNLSGSIITSALKTVSYKHWNVTPYFFSPLFHSGHLLHPFITLKLPKSTIKSSFYFDYEKMYNLPHQEWYTEFTEEKWDIEWIKPFRKNIGTIISYHHDSRLSPKSYVQCRLDDTIPDLLRWNVISQIYKNFQLGGSLGVSYLRVPHFTFNINSAWMVNQRGRNFSFYNNGTLVEYHAKKYTSGSLHSSIEYQDTIFFPIQASIWLDYYEKPCWETVEYVRNNVFEKYIIREDFISNPAKLSLGGHGNYDINFKKFRINLWTKLALAPPKGELFFSLPHNLGIDLSYGKPANDSLYLALKFAMRDRASVRYYLLDQDKIKQYTAPAQTSMSMSIKIPFFLPLWENNLSTFMQIDAGPLRITKDPINNQRVKEHPRGNLIGPAISLQLTGNIN